MGGACLGIDWAAFLMFLAWVALISAIVIMIVACCVESWGNIHSRTEGLLLAMVLAALAIALFVAANQLYARWKWSKTHPEHEGSLLRATGIEISAGV
mgnify:CR=1 FL=1